MSKINKNDNFTNKYDNIFHSMIIDWDLELSTFDCKGVHYYLL